MAQGKAIDTDGRADQRALGDDLKSLELCFAAVASAERGEPIVPGTVRRLPRARGWKQLP